jgi:hypothetical protein
MRQAGAVQDVAAMPEARAIALGYVEAAGGDALLAVQWLAQDLLKAEGERDSLLRYVSAGYVRRRVEVDDPRG